MEAFKICNLRLDQLWRRPYYSLAMMRAWVSPPDIVSKVAMGTKALNDMKSPLRLGWLLFASKCWSDQTETQWGDGGESQYRAERISYITPTSLRLRWAHWDSTETMGDFPMMCGSPGLGWHWQSFIPLPGDSPGPGLVTSLSSSLSQGSHLQHCSHSWLHNAENSICRFNLWWWIIFALSTNWELNPVMQRPENISKHSSCDLWCWKILR